MSSTREKGKLSDLISFTITWLCNSLRRILLAKSERKKREWRVWTFWYLVSHWKLKQDIKQWGFAPLSWLRTAAHQFLQHRGKAELCPGSEQLFRSNPSQTSTQWLHSKLVYIMKRNSIYLFVITSGFYGPARGCNLRKHQQAVSNSKVSKGAVPKTHQWKEFIIKNKKKMKESVFCRWLWSKWFQNLNFILQ